MLLSVKSFALSTMVAIELRGFGLVYEADGISIEL